MNVALASSVLDPHAFPEEKLEEINFSVDSALLRELGERLVGKPYIALAELIKNSYDADATKVVIRFGADSIEIIDNGHGMDFDEFKDFWMRVGSQHKQKKRFSRVFNRPFTGSKGVGRLAVQFLARKISIVTVSDKDNDSELDVLVDWDDAVAAGELTEAVARYRETDPTAHFPDENLHGTAIKLTELNQQWTPNAIVELAREIWPLQPPFRTSTELISEIVSSFEVELQSPDNKTVKQFDRQMRAILDIWTARLAGRLISRSGGRQCTVQLSLEFSDGTRFKQEYPVRNCTLNMVQFEIRIFKLERRQPFGIRVGEARDYFRRFGGIHVYDAGFHLPYYGTVESDWLRIQYDHASRRGISQLLPISLQVERGLQFLPTNSRLFGVVHVNTSLEQQEAENLPNDESEEYLKIQVTRDRLVDNKAYQQLVNIVRWSLDYYSMQEKARSLQYLERSNSIEPSSVRLERIEDILERYRPEIPEPVYQALGSGLKNAIEARETEAELILEQTSLLGSLATVGMSALAYEHEVKKLEFRLNEIAQEIRGLDSAGESIHQQLDNIAERIDKWLGNSQEIRALFSPFLDEENRSVEDRFRARYVAQNVAFQLGVLMREIRPQVSNIDNTLRLPQAKYTEWSAIFQNIYLNAVNAMADIPLKKLDVSSQSSNTTRALIIQDTGVGVDLATSQDLFKPFVRRLEISPERRLLGAGGSGLGLTIVRMIANSLDCAVSFVEPEDGYQTAFRISWKERR